MFNTRKKLIVLLEKDFKNTLQNKKYVLGQRQDIFLPEKIKQEMSYEFEYSNHRKETETGYDSDVVEIFADDIIDISDENTEVPKGSYKWEEDEWYKSVKVKQEDEKDCNVQSNCELANNEDTKPAIFNKTEKTNKVRTRKNVKVKDIQLREIDDNDKHELDPFAESDDSDYIPEAEEEEEEDESDGENILPDDHLSSDTSDSCVDSYPSFGERIKKKGRKKTGRFKVINRLSEEEMKILQKARSFVCTMCHLELNRASERIPHRKSHGLRYLSFETRYKCPICLQITQTTRYFKVHYQTHVGNKIFTDVLRNCAYCPYKTAIAKNYKAHQLAHKVKSELRCEFCSYSTTCQTVLTKHLKLHNKFSSGVYSCKSCDYSTKLSHTLRKHVKAMHLSNEEKDWIYCPQCPFRALEANNVKKHLQCHERNNTNFKCPHCTYSSDHANRVRAHLKVHYDKKEDIPEYNPEVVKPVFTCPECPYKTNIKMHLKRHGLVHSNRRIKCADCPYTCRDKADMIKHVRWHRNESRLKCRWCSFRHTTVWAMTKHERLHDDTRLADFEKSTKKNKDRSRCPICKAIFSAPSQVRMHMSKHNTLDEWEDPVFCANCPFKSKAKDLHFIKHVLCHLKKDGIKCDFCTFRHDLKRVMTIHLKLHIKEEK